MMFGVFSDEGKDDSVVLWWLCGIVMIAQWFDEFLKLYILLVLYSSNLNKISSFFIYFNDVL